MKLYGIMLLVLLLIPGCMSSYSAKEYSERANNTSDVTDKLSQFKMRDIEITKSGVFISFQHKPTWIEYFIIVIENRQENPVRLRRG